jgi:hypothetical protein
MHTRFIYITNKATNSAQAIEEAHTWFNSFVSQDQAYDKDGNCIDEYANVAFFDWYEIGGRWNNDLVFADLDDRRLVDLYKNSEYLNSVNANAPLREFAKQKFSLFFPNIDNPFKNLSGGINNINPNSNSMLITENIYNNLISTELKDSYIDYYLDGIDSLYNTTDILDVPKNYLIGKAYAVVVDYHN